MKKIKILGVTYKILYRNFSVVEKDHARGYISFEDNEIHINNTLHKDEVFKILAHEITHAYLAETAFRHTTLESCNIEEFICDVAANVTYLMKDYKEQ